MLSDFTSTKKKEHNTLNIIMDLYKMDNWWFAITHKFRVDLQTTVSSLLPQEE